MANSTRGNTASKNLERRQKRGIRRNNQRFKQRRDRLVTLLRQHGLYPTDDLLQADTETLYGLRARAASEALSLQEFGRVLLHLNQRRGFLSNRMVDDEEAESTEFKDRIRSLEEALEGRTIGQQLNKELTDARHPHEVLLRERTYLRASYLEEFDRIWDVQRDAHPDVPDRRAARRRCARYAVRPDPQPHHLLPAAAQEREGAGLGLSVREAPQGGPEEFALLSGLSHLADHQQHRDHPC